MAFLHAQGGSLADTHDRQKWQSYEPGWLASFGCNPQVPCVKRVKPDHFMWETRCLQGCIRGSQTFFWTSKTVSELRAREGWVVQVMEEGAGVQEYLAWTLSQCGAHTLHIRVFSRFDIEPLHIQNSLMSRFVVCEWSLHHGSSENSGLPLASEAWEAAHREFL